jgi:hypothetical protein
MKPSAFNDFSQSFFIVSKTMLTVLTKVIVNMLDSGRAVALVPRMLHARAKISRINSLGIIG